MMASNELLDIIDVDPCVQRNHSQAKVTGECSYILDKTKPSA